jgi:D-alanine-D-alanine ligase
MSNNNRLPIAIIFGGASAEHEVSVVSARNVSRAIDRGKYEVELVYIGHPGIRVDKYIQ